MEYEDENTTERVAYILNLTTPTVRHRTHVLGIHPEVKGRKFLYSDNQIERIKNYQRKKYFSNKVELKTRFAVIELYLSIKENSVKNISESTGISISTVTYILTDYFKNNKTIVVESKMNQL